jgi:hypothetical protein
VYNLERAEQENSGYQAEDGNINTLSRQTSYDSCGASATDRTRIQKTEEKRPKELTKEVLID